jgi:N-acetyl-anhydromuramyl-L-alanine amidase AmpD
MGSNRRHLRTTLLLLALAAAAVPVATGAQKIAIARSPNYTDAQRPSRAIDQIVVHVTEGHFWGSVRTLRSHGAHSSSHFIVGTKGQIVQLVSTSDIAWHAGNWMTNMRSIGIEHEGWSYRKGTITDKEYRASARLAARLVRNFGIPIDRKHIIAHAEVPDPYHRGEIGGIDGHTDPGPYWRWGYYLNLIRDYAKNPQPVHYVRAVVPKATAWRRPSASRTWRPRPVVDRVVRCGFRPSVHSTTLYGGQRVAGLVAWRAKACGRRIHRVDFFVDGKLKWVDRETPFAFARGRGLNTTNLANGWHTISMRGYGARGHRVRKRLRIDVDNARFAVRIHGVAPQQSLRGKVRVSARPNAAAWVALLVDGQVVRKGKPAPHVFAWDTSKFENGTHRLELQAEALDGRRATASIPVVVLNGAPTTTFAAHVDWQSLMDWQTVDGPIVWEALASGQVAQVEFWVDGKMRSVDLTPPYVFGADDGVWDATAESPGAHELTVKAIGADGHASESAVTVFVPALKSK